MAKIRFFFCLVHNLKNIFLITVSLVRCIALIYFIIPTKFHGKKFTSSGVITSGDQAFNRGFACLTGNHGNSISNLQCVLLVICIPNISLEFCS